MVEWIFELNIFEVQNIFASQIFLVAYGIWTQGKGIWDTHSFKRDYNVETKCKFSIDTIFIFMLIHQQNTILIESLSQEL